MKLRKVSFIFLSFLFLGLAVSNLTPLAHAGVGLEYLGPNPLRPQPVNGQPNTLGAGAIIGNTGNEIATITFTLVADQNFGNQFGYHASDNNFSLNPNTRMNFAILFTFNPNTIAVKDYKAAIKITASPTSKSGTSGSASFDLAVVISADVLSSSYTGGDITLTTSTSVQTMTPSPPTLATSSTTSTPQTNSLSTGSLSVDPNLLIGLAIGAVIVIVVLFARKRGSATTPTKPSSSEPAKAITSNASTNTCVRCGTMIRSNDMFCDSCGAKQGG